MALDPSIFDGALPAAPAPGVATTGAPDPGSIFDGAPDATAPNPTSASPPAPPPPGQTGYAANAAAGAVEGGAGVLNVLSDPFGNLVGKPLATLGMAAHDALAPVFGYERFTPDFRAAMLGDTVPQPGTRIADAVGRAMGAPATSDIQPATAGQAFVRGAVPAAVGMAALGGGEGLLRNVLINPLLGVSGEAGGEAFSSIAPDWLKPAASLVGNVAGMAAPMGAEAFFTKPNTLLPAAQPLIADQRLRDSITAKQAATAGEQLKAGTSDLPATLAVLDNPPAPLIPGDQPTTAKLTGDPGIAAAEYTASRGVGPIPERVTQQQADFANQINAQNDARVGAIQSIAPAGDVGAADAALKAHAAAADAANAAQVATAQAPASTAAAALPGDLGSDAGGQVGSALRVPVAAAEEAARTTRGAMYNAVDPDGNLALGMSDVRAGGARVAGEMSVNAAPMAGAEKGIFDTVAKLPDVQSFGDARALRSRITNAIRDERAPGGNPEAVRRLSMLLAHVDGVMNDATVDSGLTPAPSNAAASLEPADAGLPTAGTTTINAIAQQPEDATVAPLAGGLSDNGNAGTLGQPPNSFDTGSGDRGPLPGGYSGPGEAAEIPERAGGQNEGNRPGQLGAGDRDLANADAAPGGLTPNLDPAAVERLRAANAQNVADIARFRTAPGVGQMLKPGPSKGTFATPASALPNIIVKVGSDGADVARAYLNAGGDPAALANAAGWSLRQAAMRDGRLDPAAVERWAKPRAAFLSAVPDLAAKINDAASAQALVDTAAAGRADATVAMQKSAVGKFLGDADPVATIWSVLNDKTTGAAKARQLKAAIAGDPLADAGMRRMVGEAIEKNLVGVPKGVTSAEGQIAANGLQNFMKHAEPALAELLSPGDLARLKATQEMMVRDYRSAQVGVGSSTGQLTAGRSSLARQVVGSLFRNIGGGSIGGALGSWLGGYFGMPGVGAAMGAGTGMHLASLVQTAREAGIQNVADLKAAAYLNPALFRVLATEVTPKNRTSLTGGLAATLRRASLIGAAQSTSRQTDEPPRNALLH